MQEHMLLHTRQKQLCFCDTWYVLFCVDDCLVSTLHTRQSSVQNNKYQVSHKYSYEGESKSKGNF